MKCFSISFAGAMLGAAMLPANSVLAQTHRIQHVTALPVPGAYQVTWFGEAGHVYFIQCSTDLQTWHYAPIVLLGEGAYLSSGFCSNTDATHVRLEYSLLNTFTTAETSDVDGDGLSNIDEITIHGTRPGVSDSDGDGLSDGAEIAAGTSSPLVFDLPQVAVLTAWRKSVYTDTMSRPSGQTYTRSATADGSGAGNSDGNLTNRYTWTSLPQPTNAGTGFPLTWSAASSANWVSGQSTVSPFPLRLIPLINPPLTATQADEIPAAWLMERLHGTSTDFIVPASNTNVEQYRGIAATGTVLERRVRVRFERPLPRDWRVYYRVHSATLNPAASTQVWTVSTGSVEWFQINAGQTHSSSIHLQPVAATNVLLPGRTRISSSTPWITTQVHERRAITWIEFVSRTTAASSQLLTQPGDADKDGIPDTSEPALGFSPTLADSNGDGLGDGDSLMPSLIQPETENYSQREVEYAWQPDDPKCPGHPARRIEVRRLSIGTIGKEDPTATALGIAGTLQSKIDSLGLFPANPPAANIPPMPDASDTAAFRQELSVDMPTPKPPPLLSVKPAAAAKCASGA